MQDIGEEERGIVGAENNGHTSLVELSDWMVADAFHNPGANIA